MAELEVIFGPPGTGKTTTLTAVASEAIRTEGTDRLMVCAFTRTAAQELVGRGLEIEARQRGTLHAICFHGLDRPPLAEKQYAAWNAAYPLYALSSAQSSGNLDPDDPQRYDGDACLQELNNARHRLDAVSTLSPQATAFWQCWEHWKKDEGYLDFTDLLVYARRVLPIAPFVNAPYTLLVDEAQDLSLLQWAVLRQWARHATRFVAAGDDDQALYNWAAADVRPLLAASSRRVLPQSYRVPRAHQALALRYCAAIRIRQPKTWQPRGTEGELIQTGHDWHEGELWAAHACQWLDNPDTWGTLTFLAPCSYMLQPLVMALRAAGVPFANRWRTTRGDWNPLMPPARGTGMVQRLLDYLKTPERLWTWRELGSWAPALLRSEGCLAPGAKTEMTARAADAGVCRLNELQRLFLPHALDGALAGALAWLEEAALPAQRQALAYLCRVYRRYGRDAVTDEPRIRVGTVHSFKGAESDMVVFFTDLSRSQRVSLSQGNADDIWRMRYVAVTRARSSLILAGAVDGSGS